MNVLTTPHQKKSAVITTLIAGLLMLLFFTLGLTYFSPPISYGMEVNLGTSTSGSGVVQPPKPPAQQAAITEETPEEEVQQAETSPQPPSEVKEETKVLTESESEVAVDEKEKSEEDFPPEPKEILEEIVEKVEELEEPKPDLESVKPKPEISESTKSVLSGLINNNKREQVEGEGDDAEVGDKGKQGGNPYANSYYNQAGLGGVGKGYGLNGRNLQSGGKVVQECNQEGIVVVRITVNRKGEVVLAEPGVKGSTNTHPCLLEPAKKTAELHRWHSDGDAPQKQIGFVVIQFKLGE